VDQRAPVNGWDHGGTLALLGLIGLGVSRRKA
jgi:hypothetical protein